MESLTRSQLIALAKLDPEPGVSLFLPVLEPAAGARQEPVRLRNLLRTARDLLAEAGLDEDAARELLAPAEDRVDEAGVWTGPPGGLALYLARGFFRAVRVGFELPERVRVGRRFALRPLLPSLTRAGRFYVLGLSLNRVRLLEADADGFRRLELPSLPASFDAAMDYVQYDSDVRIHTSSPSALGPRPAIFHGSGDDDAERREANLRNFFRRLAGVLERELPEPEAPLLLAAVGSHPPIFRRVSRRLHLLEPAIAGNPDYLTDAELVAAARARVEADSRGAAERAAGRWAGLEATGRSLGELEEIVPAADQGRVEELLVARGAERWGTWEPDLGRLTLHDRREAGDDDLIELAVGRTIAQGGDAFELPTSSMPGYRIAAAILRYAPVPTGPEATLSLP